MKTKPIPVLSITLWLIFFVSSFAFAGIAPRANTADLGALASTTVTPPVDPLQSQVDALAAQVQQLQGQLATAQANLAGVQADDTAQKAALAQANQNLAIAQQNLAAMTTDDTAQKALAAKYLGQIQAIQSASKASQGDWNTLSAAIAAAGN